MTRALSLKWHAAKARKRLADPPPDYPAPIDYTRPVKRITVEDLRTGRRNELTLFISTRRTDQFRVQVNGEPWKEAIGYSRLMAGLRKAR